MRMLKRNLMIVLILLMAVAGVFTACSSTKNFTIRFETNGGNAIESVTLTEGEEYTLPTPVYEAHGFDGWYDNEACTGTAYTVIVADKDMTFYAKWKDLYPVRVELNGGHMSQTEFYLEAGANVYDFMKDHIPELDGDHIFGAWYVGDRELSPNTTMTSEGITLSAHYKVKFTVKPYLQTDDGYEMGEEYVGYGYEGTLPSYEIEGYEENLEHEGTVAWHELSGNASENSFTIYYDREQVTISLYSNYPDGRDAEVETISAPYGATVKLPTERFTAEGYCLIGWGTSLTSGVEYDSAYLYEHLFSKEGVEAPEDYKVEEEQTLYAVWARGNTDMFGGYDVVYHFSESDPAVYICRNGIFLKATYRDSNKIFVIQSASGEIILQGKFSEGNTFCYFDRTRNGSSYALYEGRRVNNNVTLHFDGYNGVEYVQPEEDGVHNDTSEGTFVLETQSDGMVYYIATFTTGKMAGQTLTIRIGYVSGTTGDERINVFQIRANEDVELGILYRFADLEHYYPSAYMVLLNGFGTAMMSMGSNTVSFYYEREDDIVTLYNARNEVEYVLHLAKMGSQNGYYLFEDDLAHTFTSEDGAQLELDGIYSATYTNGNTVVKGVYNTSVSSLGGTIVVMTAEEQTYCFYLTTTTEQNEEGEITKYNYTFKQLTTSYGEFLYADTDGVSYIPLLVLDDGGEGKASLYGYPGVRTYTKFADATYTYDEENNLYAFEITKHYEVENMTAGFTFDVSKLQSFVCGFLSVSGYRAYYLYSVTLEDEEPTNYSEKYTSGEETLTLVAGFGFYKTAEGVILGQYSLSNNILTLTTADASYTFELNDEQKTFVRLTQLLGTAYAMTAAGGTNRNQSMTFDGKGGVVYRDTDSDLTVEGTFRQSDDQTLLGSPYFLFVSKDSQHDFSFMLYTSGNSVIFKLYDEKLAGYYYSENSETLILDGYAGASFTDADGQTYTGIYSYDEESNMIRVTVESGYLYIDLRGEDAFSLRGPEYTSVCLYLDNQTLVTEVLFALDGYGKLTVYDGEGEVIDENGTYKNLDGNRYLFTYQDKEGKQVSVSGVLGVVGLGASRYLALIVEHDGVVGAYVNETDLSVLTLDAYGSAVRYDGMGRAENGNYLLVTESILYYFTDSDACIYNYDVSRGVATPAKFTAYGYYTASLEALNFSEYGYVYIEGERCYFTLENGNVIIYRAAREGDTNVNIYGFVEDRTFGSFSDAEKHYNNKTYYRSDGYSITFSRAAEGNEKYPILTEVDEDGNDVYTPLGDLNFSPRGNGEFNATATVMIGERRVNSTVVRDVLEDGTVELYLRVNANVGYYRFDLDIEYFGDSAGPGKNVYSINSMKYIVELPSYNYLYYYYLMYMLSGGTAAMENVFGTLSVTKICSEEGKIMDDSSYLDLQLGEMLPLEDYDGNLFNLSHKEFEESDGSINYTVKFQGEDGYDYILRLSRTYFSQMRQYGFNIYSLTRVHTFEVDLGEEEKGTLEVERVIFSELTGVAPGVLWDVRLYDSEKNLLESESYSYLADGVVHYIVRERTDDRITKTTYYYITLTEKVPEDVDDPTANRVQPYTEASVEKKEMTTRYSENGESFADIDSEDKIVLFVIGRTVYLVAECTKEGNVYNIQTTSGRTFKVTESDQTLTFEEITEEPNE